MCKILHFTINTDVAACMYVYPLTLLTINVVLHQLTIPFVLIR